MSTANAVRDAPALRYLLPMKGMLAGLECANDADKTVECEHLIPSHGLAFCCVMRQRRHNRLNVPGSAGLIVMDHCRVEIGVRQQKSEPQFCI
jgi:hypothetical protein